MEPFSLIPIQESSQHGWAKCGQDDRARNAGLGVEPPCVRRKKARARNQSGGGASAATAFRGWTESLLFSYARLRSTEGWRLKL